MEEDQCFANVFNLLNVVPKCDYPIAFADLLDLIKEEDIKQSIKAKLENPIEIAHDPTLDKPYLKCDYNCHEQSFRSPWSNEYFPSVSTEEVYFPNQDFLEKEKLANEKLSEYAYAYYGPNAISSAYLWDPVVP